MSARNRENPFLNIFLNVIIPSVILIKFSSDDWLGPTVGLLVAIAFPIGYGTYDFIRRRKINFFSALGLASVVLTGGVGVLQLNKTWVIAKETGVPLIIGVTVIVSQMLNRSLLKMFFGEILNMDAVYQAYRHRGHDGLLEKQLRISTYAFGLSFFISAVLNYFLAVTLIMSDPGTSAFNEELGKMTAISFPVIAVPMTVILFAILVWLFRSIRKFSGLEIDDIINA